MMGHEHFDVCLIYEHYGNFQGNDIRPWFENLINSMPSTKFSVVAIHSGDAPHEILPLGTAEPSSFHHINIDIRKAWEIPQSNRSTRRTPALPAASELLDALFLGEAATISDAMEKLQHQLEVSPKGARAAFLHGEPNWQMLRDSYNRNSPGEPFQEFFHLARALLAPLYAFAELVDVLPEANSYHALSHGYAGYLGTLLQKRHNARLISSNKGSQTLPKREQKRESNRTTATMRSFEHADFWLRLRDAMQRVTNNHATAITTTSQYQFDLRRKELGPIPAIHLIPEGIDTDYYHHFYTQHSAGPPPVVATIGPVVPTRDVKGFIRAIANLRERLPHITAWVVGSLHSDPHYAKECKSLVRNLGLYNHLRFFGDQDESTIYPRIGALVINTLSDTPPITLQQAQAAGVPVIATNVGACKELIEGRNEQDQELGASGAVVPIADPVATASAIAVLFENPEVWKSARSAGIKRCQRYYGLDVMLQQYQNLYQHPKRAA